MINKLKELLEAATPGPWSLDEYGDLVRFDANHRYRVAKEVHTEEGQLIVAMRNCLPELLAVVEAADTHLRCGFCETEQELRWALTTLEKKVGDNG